MGLDFGLTADSIVTVISILGGGFVFLFRMEGKLNVLTVERRLEVVANTHKFSEIAKQFEAIEKQLEKLTECILQQARLEQKISTIEDKLIALANGGVIPKNGNPKRKYAAKS